MKYVLALLLWLAAFTVSAETWVQFDIATNKILSVRSGDGVKLGYCSVNNTNIASNVLLDPDLSALSGIPMKYWKQSGGSVVEMSQAEKDAVDAAELIAQSIQESTNVDNLDITIKDAFTAWLQLYNSKVPAQYQITGAELKQQVKTNKGL